MGISDDLGAFPVLGRAHPIPICDAASQETCFHVTCCKLAILFGITANNEGRRDQGESLVTGVYFTFFSFDSGLTTMTSTQHKGGCDYMLKG